MMLVTRYHPEACMYHLEVKLMHIFPETIATGDIQLMWHMEHMPFQLMLVVAVSYMPHVYGQLSIAIGCVGVLTLVVQTLPPCNSIASA